MKLDVALQLTSQGQLISFANSFYTAEGGTHVDGFLKAFFEVIKHHAATDLYFQDDPVSTVEIGDLLGCLSAVIAVDLDKPSFDGATKRKLINRVEAWVSEATQSAVQAFFLGNPEWARNACNYVISNAEERLEHSSQK